MEGKAGELSAFIPAAPEDAIDNAVFAVGPKAYPDTNLRFPILAAVPFRNPLWLWLLAILDRPIVVAISAQDQEQEC